MGNVTQTDKKFNPSEHLMQLKGKDYLQVMWRLVWFREERANWCIDTEAHHIDKDIAIFHARIYDEAGVLKASGYGSETPKDFGDYIEKAETKAIGRALAMMGYGTQFTADELDEGTRIVDSPVQRNTPKKPDEPKTAKRADELPYYTCAECGNHLSTHTDKGGNVYGVTQIAESTKRKYGKVLCWDCAVKEKSIG